MIFIVNLINIKLNKMKRLVKDNSLNVRVIYMSIDLVFNAR